MDELTERLIGRWARLGGGFNAAPSVESPDLEAVIVDTARLAPRFSRLFDMAATWLLHYGESVARRRLISMARASLSRDEGAVLGVLLESVDAIAGNRRFASVRATLRPANAPGPLFEVHQLNEALRRRAELKATELSMTWNRWAEPIQLYHDAIRPPFWVFAHNPSLLLRADLRGDMRASVFAALRHDPRAGESESALARAAGGSRQQVRAALKSLELTGRVKRARSADGRRVEITLVPSAA